MIEVMSECLKNEKMPKSTVFTLSFAFTFIKPCQICYGFMKTTLLLIIHFLAITKTTDTFNKNKQCHMTLERLSSVCAKLEPAGSKNNEILKINNPEKIYIACSSLPSVVINLLILQVKQQHNGTC